VHVLVGERRRERAGPHVALQLVQGGEHPGQLVLVEQAGAVQHPGVRARAGQIVRREPPVELHRHRQPGQGLRRAAGEPAAPQP
jgi:hypothetical protein